MVWFYSEKSRKNAHFFTIAANEVGQFESLIDTIQIDKEESIVQKEQERDPQHMPCPACAPAISAAAIPPLIQLTGSPAQAAPSLVILLYQDSRE